MNLFSHFLEVIRTEVRSLALEAGLGDTMDLSRLTAEPG